MGMASTLFGDDVVGQSMLEKFKTAIDEGKDIQQVIDNLTNKEYKQYIQLQSKLANPEVTGAFLGNTLKIDGEDTGIEIQSLLESTGEGIFGLDDPLIKNVQSQLANNPDLTFAQSYFSDELFLQVYFSIFLNQEETLSSVDLIFLTSSIEMI